MEDDEPKVTFKNALLVIIVIVVTVSAITAIAAPYVAEYIK